MDEQAIADKRQRAGDCRPTMARRSGSSLYHQGSRGYYCSSSLNPSFSGYARGLYFYLCHAYTSNYN